MTVVLHRHIECAVEIGNSGLGEQIHSCGVEFP
jgi:hypothetical protein